MCRPAALRLAVLALSAVAPAAAGQPPSPDTETTLILIGDAGAPAARGEPVLRALEAAAGVSPQRTLVLFLGDNVYPAGFPAESARGRAEAARRLDAQVDAVRRAGARSVFIPGNHDWAHEQADGWESIRRQAAHLAARAGAAAGLLPRGGCPGPETLDLGEHLRLVLLDTQWWLHDGPRPQGPGSGCAASSESEVLAALGDAVAATGARQVVVAGHHPLRTGGPHGGHFTWKDHLFPLRAARPWLWLPLPLIGSAYPSARQAGITSQDLAGEANRRLRAAIEGAFERSRPLVYASGHEHTLQVLEGSGARHLLVSGAGIFGHTSAVKRLPDTRFASSRAGFMRLDVGAAGRVRLTVLEVDARGTAREAYVAWLD
ncbi:MAG: metallophosphoesterase [Vicinamibacteria bacterium]